MRVPALVCLALLASATLAAQSIDIGPAPGRLIDVGGRKLHFNCTGPAERTGPTVILEAGASSFAIDWALVQPEIARTYRVCSYDRAGSGWSDPRPDVETPARVVVDLHTLLGAAGEKPPYVMVGASAGGLYVRLYELDYPSEVIGLVRRADPFSRTTDGNALRSPASRSVSAANQDRSAAHRVNTGHGQCGDRAGVIRRSARRTCSSFGEPWPC